MSLKRRKNIAKIYYKNLSNIESLKLMPQDKDCSYFVFQIFHKKRDKLLKEFRAKKIESASITIHPLHKMTYFKKKYKLDENDFKNSNKYGNNNISLPIYPKLKIKKF